MILHEMNIWMLVVLLYINGELLMWWMYRVEGWYDVSCYLWFSIENKTAKRLVCEYACNLF